MAASYRLRPQARNDLRSIWRYSRHAWSADQADKYVRLIKDAIERLAASPERGRSAEDIKAGYRKQRVGSHLIFYRLSDRGIEVVRILHQRMDIAAQLDADD